MAKKVSGRFSSVQATKALLNGDAKTAARYLREGIADRYLSKAPIRDRVFLDMLADMLDPDSNEEAWRLELKPCRSGTVAESSKPNFGTASSRASAMCSIASIYMRAKLNADSSNWWRAKSLPAMTSRVKRLSSRYGEHKSAHPHVGADRISLCRIFWWPTCSGTVRTAGIDPIFELHPRYRCSRSTITRCSRFLPRHAQSSIGEHGKCQKRPPLLFLLTIGF